MRRRRSLLRPGKRGKSEELFSSKKNEGNLRLGTLGSAKEAISKERKRVWKLGEKGKSK